MIFSQCPTPDCKWACFAPVGKALPVTCESCGKCWCANCLLPPHPGKTCEEKATDDWLNDPDNVAFRRCPKCSVIIERIKGCKFMTCQSAMCAKRTFFCMVCMKVFKSSHEPHTCRVEGYAYLPE